MRRFLRLRNTLTHEERAGRRRHMAEAVHVGASIKVVAGRFGVSVATVYIACSDGGLSLKRGRPVLFSHAVKAKRDGCMVEAVFRGASVDVVGEVFGVSVGVVRWACRNSGVKPLTSSQIGRLDRNERMAEAVLGGASSILVGEVFGVSVGTVRLACRENGVTIINHHNEKMRVSVERVDGMLHLRVHGFALKEIGVIYRVTRERVRQILAERCDFAGAVPLLMRIKEVNVCSRDGCDRECAQRKFCSNKCRALNNDSNSSKVIFETFTCDGCGCEFKRSRYLVNITRLGGKCKKKFCTSKCYFEHGLDKRPLVTLTCDGCGCEFERRGGIRAGCVNAFCSRKCNQKNRLRVAMVALTCDGCGCEFERCKWRVDLAVRAGRKIVLCSRRCTRVLLVARRVIHG